MADRVTGIRRRWFVSIVPLVQIVLYGALIWYSCPYTQVVESHLFTERPVQSAPDGSVPFEPTCIDGRMPAPEEIAEGLNLPAVIVASVATPLLARVYPPIGLGCVYAEYSQHILTLVLAPFLWYVVGILIYKRVMAQTVPRLPVRMLAAGGIFAVAILIVAFRSTDFLITGLFMLAWVAASIALARLPWRRRTVSRT